MPDDKPKQSKQSQRTSDRQRGQSKNGNNGNNSSNNNNNNHNQDNKQSTAKDQTNTNNRASSACSSLEQFSAKAQEIKNEIYEALEKQSQLQIPDEPVEIVQLKNDILKLSGSPQDTNEVASSPSLPEPQTTENSHIKELNEVATSAPGLAKPVATDTGEISPKNEDKSLTGCNNDTDNPKKKSTAIKSNNVKSSSQPEGGDDPSLHGSFEPLSAKLDQKTKYISLVSSLKKDLEGSPAMIEPICKKLVQMSELISKLQSDCENYSTENKKLLVIKQKLENLCRELQKSNNAIRIESLDLIKLEQGKAKEQTTKIQSTLSGVIKLFDENQQRNMTLRQENQELQTKLRSLLEHCDSWEKGFAAALRQREIEIRLVKTELAKANLLKNEEKERFLKEKKDLLQLLSMMQEHQSRIESQEAKLRLDLSNYASKYDECQDVISKGMLKFQTESKRMLKQIEKSKQDYKMLLTKYESSSKRMAQLLEEKQRWERSTNVANKKIETLEKLCRALREQKLEQSKGGSANGINQQSKNMNNSSNSKSKKEKPKPTAEPAHKEDNNQQQPTDDARSTGHVDDGGDSGPMVVTGEQANSHMNPPKSIVNEQ